MSNYFNRPFSQSPSNSRGRPRSRDRSRSPQRSRPTAQDNSRFRIFSNRKNPNLSKQDQQSLGLDDLIKKQTGAQKQLFNEHNRFFGSGDNGLDYVDLPVHQQQAATKLGIKYYDKNCIPLHRTQDDHVDYVLRQSIRPGAVDGSGKAARTEAHMSRMYITAGLELLDLEPAYKTNSTDKAEEFFKTLQNKHALDLPRDPTFIRNLIQLFGESWWFIYTLRQQAPVLTKVLSRLYNDLPNGAEKSFLKTFHWNLSQSLRILSLHDKQLHSCSIAMKYQSDPKAWQSFIEKTNQRRKEYRFDRKDDSALITPYADMLVDPEVLERQLTRSREAYNRSRREKKKKSSGNSYRRDKYNPSSKKSKNNKRNNNNNPKRKQNRGSYKDGKYNRKNKPSRNNNRRKTNNNKKQETGKSKNKTKCNLCGMHGHATKDCPNKAGWN